MLGYISALMLIMIVHISLKLIGIAKTIDLHKLSCRSNCEALLVCPSQVFQESRSRAVDNSLRTTHCVYLKMRIGIS